MYRNNYGLMKKGLVPFILFLFFTAFSVSADVPMSGINAIFTDGIIDLRPIGTLFSRSANTPERSSTPDDLEIGSIFITADNEARKVVDIYEYNGKTVIETTAPRPEEVFNGVSVPEFDISCTDDSLGRASLSKGVTLLPKNAAEADKLSSSFKQTTADSRSVLWYDTDPEVDDLDTLRSFNVDITLWKKEVKKEIIEELKKIAKEGKKEEKNQNSDSDDNSSSDDNNNNSDSSDDNNSNNSDSSNDDDNEFSETELEISASGEIKLKGTLNLKQLRVEGELNMPSCTVSWVHDWWIVYHPEFHLKSGSAKCIATVAQEFDFKLIGTASLAAELSVPLLEVIFLDPNTTIKVSVGISAKIGIDGNVSLTAEVSEYSRMTLGGECKLSWPFIPYKIKPAFDNNYMNFAFRPTIAAEVTTKAGLYLGGSLGLLGIDLVELEGGGGIYLTVGGYVEPLGIMGYNTDDGFYGNFNDWIIAAYAEAGAYAEVGIKIITIPIDIWDDKWPFWNWDGSLEI